MTNLKEKKFHLSEGPFFNFSTQELKKDRNRNFTNKENAFYKQSYISFTNPKLHEAWQFSNILLKSLDPILDILINILIDTSHLHKPVKPNIMKVFLYALGLLSLIHPEFKETVSRDFVYIFNQTTFPVYNRHAKEGFRNLSKLLIFVFIFWSHRR
jgi:hypothetical protein